MHNDKKHSDSDKTSEILRKNISCMKLLHGYNKKSQREFEKICSRNASIY